MWESQVLLTNGQVVFPLVFRFSPKNDQKLLKSFQSEIQDGRHGGRLENLFFASCPEPKGQLT